MRPTSPLQHCVATVLVLVAAMALPALPEVKGVFGTAWFYDPAIRGISPRISFAQDLQVGRGACRFEIGSDPAAIANATATSANYNYYTFCCCHGGWFCC